MKVLMVLPGVRGAGGAERSLAAMAPHLCRELSLTVVTLTGKTDLRGTIESAGAEFVDLRPHTRRQAVMQLTALMRSLPPDLVHTTLVDADLVGRVAAARSKVPVVSSLVNTSYGRAQLEGSWTFRAKKAAFWAGDIATARLAVRFHALTQHVACTATRQLLIPPSRLTVIPRGRDPELLGRSTPERRLAARRLLGVSDETPLVIAAARQEHQKGLDIALRAFAAVKLERPDARFIIAGREGLQSSLLAVLSADLGLTESVQFLGQRDDVAELMCAADVWCVPSRWEGLGSILVEAMALEVPVVASSAPAIVEVGGTPSVFRIFPVGDHHAMARSILDLLGDEHARRVVSSRGRARFLEKYTVDSISNQMIAFYDQAVAESRRRNRSHGA